MKDVSCIILAGGKSKRMGRDKKFLLLNGRSFLEIAVDNGRALSSEVIISLGTEEQRDEVLARGFDVVTVIDNIKQKGPLAGLCTALEKCTKEYVVVLPCDTPLISREIIYSLLENCEGWDAVVPVVRDFPEPLIAVYRVESLQRACREAIKAGTWKVGEVIKKLEKIKYYPMDTRCFLNVNTPQDMEEVRRHGR